MDRDCLLSVLKHTKMLYFVFTVQEGDIVNCRMAAKNLETAEKECIIAMRANRKRCVRIVCSDIDYPVGTRIWIDVKLKRKTHDIKILGVYKNEEEVPSHSDWVEDLVVV